MANTASAISSPAPGPTMPTPITRPDAASAISLVSPSERPIVAARPDEVVICDSTTIDFYRLASAALDGLPRTGQPEMGKDPLNDGRVLDRGDELHPPGTARTA